MKPMRSVISKDIFKESVMGFVDSMKVPDEPIWAYKLTKNSDVTIFSSCFALFIKDMFGKRLINGK